MIHFQEISYRHPNQDLLFSNLNFTINPHEKIALIGNNGAGKSTLLKIIAGEILPTDGKIISVKESYVVPQIFDPYKGKTIAEALKIDKKLNALTEILQGNTKEINFDLLNEDWTIEERSKEALKNWQLKNVDLFQKMETLSGGQKTKVLLAGISIHQPDLILLDEPTNQLDKASRQILYEFIKTTKSTLVVVSHDRKLLNLLPKVCELSQSGINVYGGNYDFYFSQKQAERKAIYQTIQNQEKSLRKAKDKARESLERQQKLDNRGKGKQEKSGVARIMMNTLRNNAEKSTSKIKTIHAEKVNNISRDLHTLRSSLADFAEMKFGLDNSTLHKGKILITTRNINFTYETKTIWNQNLNFQIRTGERIVLKGSNGSGKTTLIKFLIGDIKPQIGTINRSQFQSIYIDQDYSILQRCKKVYEQAQVFNVSSLEEHEVKTRLNRFLFTKDDWDKSCNTLSGGERMRLLLCCMTLNNLSPDLIVLDEPTNNLDLQNVEILTAAVNEYQGTLVVVSHDETFLNQIQIQRTIDLDNI